MPTPDENERLRSAALQNASSILAARERAEAELRAAKAALELKTSELANSLAVMRATLESTTDGILVTDEAGNATNYNDNYARLWRVPPDILKTGSHRALVEYHATQFPFAAAYLARIDEIYATAPAETFDVLELADGRVFERTTRVQNVAGRAVGRVWSFRDITPYRRAEEALRDETRILELLNTTGVTLASKLELNALVQSAADAATQLSGAEFGVFFYRPPGAAGVADEIRALSGGMRDSFDPRTAAGGAPFFGPQFRDESAVRCDDTRGDSRFEAPDPQQGMPGALHGLRSYLAVPVRSGTGEVVGGLAFGHSRPAMFSDRSVRIIQGIAAQAAVAIDNAHLYEGARRSAEERKILLERERLARAEAERAGELKDEFLATLSHELRTPLSSILGWSMILRRQRMTETEVHQALDTIERNARVQTQLIEDLLDMSRITSGKIRLDVQTVEPAAFIEAALETVRPAADAKGIRLEKFLDTTVGAIAGDPSRLQQVIWNLVANAIKFTPKGGKVQVMLERVNSHIEISVADTGIGIKPEFLPYVFDRFRQEDSSTTRVQGGLGLGLAIVKSLVELHGGTVRVASAGEGRGTTFSIDLPLTVVHRAAKGGERRHPSTGQGSAYDYKLSDLSGLRLLVVDDERDARELIQRVLSDCGAQVLIAGSASQALAIVEAERPDLLLSDIGMPEVDGYELLRRVRNLGEARGGRLPAVALTAFARSEDRTRALRAGFIVHLVKPVEPAELIATIASLTGRTA